MGQSSPYRGLLLLQIPAMLVIDCGMALSANYRTRRQQSIRRQVVFGPRRSRRTFALGSAPIAGLIPAEVWGVIEVCGA